MATSEEDIPKALRSRPVLSPMEQHYWTMYHAISGSRNYSSAGPLSIPYSVKLLWLDENEIEDKDERKDYLYMIEEIDGAYLDHFYEKSKEAS